MQPLSAFAHINIALIKYWGKLDLANNIPATPSLSLTLDKIGTKTSICESSENQDFLAINNETQTGQALERATTFVDKFRNLADCNTRVNITSINNMPTASGLASSASGFAALALACNKFFDLDLDQQELSRLARFGAGSAARSIFGNFVSLGDGYNISDETCVAKNIEHHKSLDLNMLIVRNTDKSKSVSSRSGMIHASKTSPFFASFIETNKKLFEQAIRALTNCDLKTLGQAMEHSTLNMHATCLSANPGFWYFNPATISALNKVKFLRETKGFECYFTMDAGPHIKVLCHKKDALKLSHELQSVRGVLAVNICSPGKAAYLL